MKVYVVGKNFKTYEHMFEKARHVIVDKMEDADLVQFTGGADVEPLLYGRLDHPKTKTQFDRDKYEVEEYYKAKQLGKRIAGICRGAQFLCVMAGHELWQDVTNHRSDHKIKDKFTGRVLKVTSTHHQMMRLNKKGSEAIIIATAGHLANRKSAVEDDEYIWNYDGGDTDDEDLEVVHFPKEKSLAFQPHPEFDKGHCREYYFALLDKYLGFK